MTTKDKTRIQYEEMKISRKMTRYTRADKLRNIDIINELKILTEMKE